MYKISLILISFYIFITACALSIGDVCEDNNGIPGVCMPIENCQPVVASFRRGKLPQRCKPENGNNVNNDNNDNNDNNAHSANRTTVCCTHSSVHIENSNIFENYDNKNTLPVQDRISKRKCKEYSESVYQKISFPKSSTQTVDLCGFKSEELSIGTTNATNAEFPHMALIGYDGLDNKIAYYCSGSLISDQFVLTSGNCLYIREYGKAKYVRLGEYNLDTESESDIQDFSITLRIKHPDFKRPSLYNDIGLVKLNSSAKFGAFVRPICLHSSEEINSDKAIATGWGSEDYLNSEVVKVMRKLVVGFMTSNECNLSFSKNFHKLKSGVNDEIQICAGSMNQTDKIYNWARGGALQIYHTDEYCMYSQIGVTSFGDDPTVYTRVSNYLEWIENIVWG